MTSVAAPTTSNATSVYGETVTFTATVVAAAPGVGTPTGTVTFKDGGTSLGTGTLTGGVATFATTTALSLGPHSITASYGGDTNFLISSSSATTQTVGQAATTGTVVSSVASPVFGQPINLIATIVAAAPGAGTPTGTVTFYDGGTLLGTGPTALNGGMATLAISSLSVATHPITVVYGGDTKFTSSTSAITSVVVGQADSTTTLSPLAPIVFGQPVTFTATVAAAAPGVGTPSQIVTFLDGATLIGFGFLNGSSKATFTTAALSEGSHSINAYYDGDPNFLTSSSPHVTQIVNQAATSVAAPTTSKATTVYGESVTFTATVVATAPGAGTPTGPVTFKDGATVLGTGTLTDGAATYSTAALSFGSHSITASYGGDTNFQSSSSSSATTQTVGQAATSVAAPTSSNTASVYGESVTFTATVVATTPSASTPTGTVTFLDNGTQIGTGTLNGSGVATYTTVARWASVRIRSQPRTAATRISPRVAARRRQPRQSARRRRRERWSARLHSRRSVSRST